ncbi:hypothetical protein ACRRTK_004817 [Alexandromys fortis]
MKEKPMKAAAYQYNLLTTAESILWFLIIDEDEKEPEAEADNNEEKENEELEDTDKEEVKVKMKIGSGNREGMDEGCYSKHFGTSAVPVVNISTLFQPPSPALAHLNTSQCPITNGTAIKRENPALWRVSPRIASAPSSSASYLRSAARTLHSCFSQPWPSGVQEIVMALTSMVQTQL